MNKETSGPTWVYFTYYKGSGILTSNENDLWTINSKHR